MALSDESSLLKDFGKISQSIGIRDSISVLSQNKKDWKNWTANQIGRAYLLTKLGKYSIADSILSKLSPEKLSSVEFQDIVDKTIAEARILNHSRKFSEAIDKLSTLKGEIFERVKNSLDRQSGHLMLTNDELESIHLLTDLYLQKSKNDQAIALQDQVKTLNKAAYLNSSVLKSNVFNDKELPRKSSSIDRNSPARIPIR
jgi:hypothetical protein